VSDQLHHLEGKYEVLSKLREGGMGAIYTVRHRLLGEIRVVKVMRPQLADDQEFAARFLREAQTAIRLRHPNIAQLYDFSTDEEGNAYIVMEFIEGIDLRELVRRFGPPSLGLTLEIAVQGLAALGFLHRRKMVHRDISPDNLMLARDADGRPMVKLIDLGIVKVLEADHGLTSTGVFLGKLRYAAPEQLLAAEGRTIDQRADLYSFGIVLYELLTGKFPIAGSTSSSLIAGHLHQAPLSFAATDPEGRVPEPLRQLVMRLLSKEPEERVGSAEELAEALAPLRRDHPWSAAELAKIMATVTPPLPGAGTPMESAQRRLDRQFGGVTPTPITAQPMGPITAEAAAPPPPSAEALEAPTELMPPPEKERTPTVPAPPPLPVTPTSAPQGAPSPELAAAPATRPRRSWLLAAALAATLIVLGGGVTGVALLKGRLFPSSPPTLPENVGGAGGAVAAAPGMLVIHAVPWAEVTEIRSAAGDLVAVPEPGVTPLAVPLPPGSYTVLLRNPLLGKAGSAEVEVRAGETLRCQVPIERIDSAAFLKKLGW
jgi:serine/threonine-protein kinase